MKFFARKDSLSRNSGTIIISVLWILVILSFLSLSLGRKSQAEVQWTKHLIEKMKSKYLAWSGIVCGIQHIYKNEQILKDLGEDKRIYYDVKDEQRLLNVNAMNASNIQVFLSLLDLLGVDKENSQTIAFSLIDWIDLDEKLSQDIYGAENDYYQSLERPYYCKNLPLDSKEELLLIRGMTSEIFNVLKDYISIWPKEGVLKVNFDTAPEIILRSFARSLTGPKTNTSLSDADALVYKIMEYRQGKEFLDVNEILFNPKEKSLMLSMNAFRIKESNYFAIHSYGETLLGVKTHAEAIFDKNNFSIVSWRRE
jgi:general secretion pathway protein K